MKRKYTVITISAAMAIILAGYVGISAIFNAYIRASSEVYEETDNSDAVKSAARESVLRCSYPLIGSTLQQATNPDADDYLENHEYYINTLFRAASMVGLNNFSDKAFREDTILTDDYYAVIDSTVNNGRDRMTAAFVYKTIYGFYIRPTAKPTEEQIKTAVEDLGEIIEKDDSLLQSFLKSVEELGSGLEENFNSIMCTATDMLYGMMQESEDPDIFADSDNSFFIKDHTLYECYQYGEKHIFTDGKETVLLSSVGSYGIAVFYDAINRKFCGVNMIAY